MFSTLTCINTYENIFFAVKQTQTLQNSLQSRLFFIHFSKIEFYSLRGVIVIIAIHKNVFLRQLNTCDEQLTKFFRF